MNFLAHYYLDSQSADSLFVIGLVTPDLMSLYNRGIRFRERDILKATKNASLSTEEQTLLKGVSRHFEADGIFHDSAFFKDESSLIGKRLRDAFPAHNVERSFFVGHVLLELCLDRLLMQEYPSLTTSFYEHFRAFSPEKIAELTSTLAGNPLPGYQEFLIRFLEKPYIPRILRRILTMVGIPAQGYEYLSDPDFEEQLLECEKILQKRFLKGLSSIQMQLKPMPNSSVR